MKTTTLKLTDRDLKFETLTEETLSLPMSLDEVANRLKYCDQARFILFARHYPNMPSYLIGVTK